MNQFTSVFKLYGVPILPPVITDAYRPTLQIFKQKAIEVEQKLQKRNNLNPKDKEPAEPSDEVESEYMKVSSMNDTLAGPSPRRKLFSQQQQQLPPQLLPETPPLLQLSPIKDEPISLELYDTPQKLVRSNSLTSNCSNKSYTIDTPSPLLIKQMQSQGINIRKSTSLPNSATKKLFRKVSPKREIKKAKAKTTIQKFNTRAAAKMTKSPYEPNYKPRNCPKTVKNQDNNESKNATRTTKVQPKSEHDLDTYQSEYNEKMKALLAKQELEQQRMKQEFERQQNELIKLMGQATIQQSKISHGHAKVISTVFTSTPLQSTTDSDSTHNISSQLSNFDVDDVTVNESFTYDDFYSCVNKTLENTAHEKTKRSPELKGENALLVSTAFERRQRLAATTITAYTKGYLCRRLIKTERVQNIIQTIRDTLLFILDLHSETSRNAIDIQLKGRGFFLLL
jgi:hypothetical protein